MNSVIIKMRHKLLFMSTIQVVFVNILYLSIVSCDYPDYVNFNEQQYKKSYGNQNELFPCPKLYDSCGDVGYCCDGLQCTDATIEQDTKDYVFERFFCGNASKTYNENVQGLRQYIQKFEMDGFV